MRILIALAVLATAITFLVVWFRPGIKVTVVNAGSQPMRSVVLTVTGHSYSLGTIAPGGTGRVTVHPASDSTLGIQYIDEGGQPQGIGVDVYLGSDFRGAIGLIIKDGKIQKTTEDIHPY